MYAYLTINFPVCIKLFSPVNRYIYKPDATWLPCSSLPSHYFFFCFISLTNLAQLNGFKKGLVRG